jgi:hypothetical protein
MGDLPLPWDGTYQQEWSTFLQQVATHYAGKQDLLMIAAAGPTSVSDEMSMPGAEEPNPQCSAAQISTDLSTWEGLTPPYTAGGYVDAWTAAFGQYATSFPSPYTSLSLYPGVPIGNTIVGGMSTSDLSQRQATPQSIIAAGEGKFGAQFVLQMNGLAYGSGGPKDTMYQLVSENSGTAVTGFQLIESATKDLAHIRTEGGPTLTAADGATALQNALEAGLTSKAGAATSIDFLQIYAADADTATTNSGVQAVLVSTAGQLPLPQYSPAYMPPAPKPGCSGSTCS